MKVRVHKTIKDGKYCINVVTEDFSQDKEIMAMEKYGEPEINVGGVYGDNGGVAALPDPPEDPQPILLVQYTMPDNMELMASSFDGAKGGFNLYFDLDDYANAEERADKWTATVVGRLQAAITALRAKIDSFTEEQVYNF